MRPQLDLRPGVMLALGAVGLGSTWTRPAAAGIVTAPSALAPLAGGLPLDGLTAAVGGRAFGPMMLAPERPGGRDGRLAISASASRRDLLVGRVITVSGQLRPDERRRAVALEERRGDGWLTIARATTSGSGRYRVGFTTTAPGSLALRVRFAGDQFGPPAVAAVGEINVYRLAGASWYGPGGSLACGGTLTPSRLGVAHKTLPCGTMVRLHLGRRTVRVPVIDRGPYVAGRDYDLTPATRRALGFGDTGQVWATR